MTHKRCRKKSEKGFWINAFKSLQWQPYFNHSYTTFFYKIGSLKNEQFKNYGTFFWTSINISWNIKMKSLFCIERCRRYLLQKRTHSSGLSIWSISSLGEGKSPFKGIVNEISTNFFFWTACLIQNDTL